MIGPRTRQVEDLHGSSRLPGGLAERIEERLLGNEAGARAGDEDAAGGHRMQRQAVHVEVLLEGEIDLVAVARLLGWIEYDDVEALARRHNVAQPGEQVGLD